MPFYSVPSGFGGGCGLHPHGRRHPFHHHHGPPHHHHHHGPHPPFGPPPMMMMMGGGPPGPPHVFGRRGRRFMMHDETNNRPDAEPASEEGPNPAMDGPPFLPLRHHGSGVTPPPPMMMAGVGGPPMFGRRERRFMRMNAAMKNAEDNKTETTDPSSANDDNAADHPISPSCANNKKPNRRRSHCRRGGPRGRCSDLPREEETPIEQQETKEGETESPKSSPPFVPFSRPFLPRPPHIHRRFHHKRFQNKMMLLQSFLEEQKRAMEELEQNKNNSSNPEQQPQQQQSGGTIPVAQQWHTAETNQSLLLCIDVTGFQLENLELKVENGLLSLHGYRTNSLGDVFELLRTKTLDSSLYNEAGIEARCDNNQDDGSSGSILRITIPKKEYIPNDKDGAIPIQVVERPNQGLNEPSTTTTTTATVVEDDEKEQTATESSASFEDNIFIPEAEIVFEPDEEEEEELGQVETVQDEDSSSILANNNNTNTLEESDAQELQQSISADDTEEEDDNDADTTQSWEDVIVDGREDE